LSNLKNLAMIVKKFKPGDWVKTKGNLDAPKMEVIKYITKKDPLVGTINSNIYLECVYYQNGERFVKTVHQDRLIKLREVGGFYKS